MSYEFPTINTAFTIALFLTVLLAVAYFVKKKSNSIKKIINNKKKINILEFLPIRGGYSAIIFSVQHKVFHDINLNKKSKEKTLIYYIE